MFQSETGIRVPAVTAGQMREIDRIAVEETGPNLLQMMGNAGSALAQCAIEMLGRDWRSARVIVFGGSGGNWNSVRSVPAVGTGVSIPV